MFFESSSKSHRLIAHLDNRQIEFYGSLKDLSNLDDRFFRCHNSYVINRNNVDTINTKDRAVYFSNGEHCYASVRNIKNINKTAYMIYFKCTLFLLMILLLFMVNNISK